MMMHCNKNTASSVNSKPQTGTIPAYKDLLGQLLHPSLCQWSFPKQTLAP